MKTNPTQDADVKITCFMPTYNRLQARPDGSIDAVIVEESIESFLRQSYPNKELIIINDTPGQRLSLPADPRYSNIFLLNSSVRFPTLGHKYRKAIEMASGDYFTPWDDDDISLPRRLLTCRQHLQGADSLIVSGFYFLDHEQAKMSFDSGNGYMNDMYRTSMARRIGYSLMSYDSDAKSRSAFMAGSSLVKYLRPDSSWHFYIYRWRASGRVHLSSLSPDESGYAHIGAQPILEVDYELKPHWRRDYVELVKEHFSDFT